MMVLSQQARQSMATDLISCHPEGSLCKEMTRLKECSADEGNILYNKSLVSASGSVEPQGESQLQGGSCVQISEDFAGLEFPLDTLEKRVKAFALAEHVYKQTVEKIKVRFQRGHKAPFHHVEHYSSQAPITLRVPALYRACCSQSSFGSFGIGFLCPLLVLAVKDATAWALRQHFPKLLNNKFFQLELADRINALFSQFFDPHGYFSR